ncbi:MAG: hypothetical protein ACJ72R_14560 [Nitrososphaeraceae archaeon]
MKSITIALFIAAVVGTGLVVGILGSQLVQPAFAQQCATSSVSGSVASGANAAGCNSAAGATSAVCTKVLTVGFSLTECEGK